MIKRILKNVVPILICILGVFVFIEAQSPFKTKEQKQVKEMYQYSFRNINTFKLKSVNPDSNNSSLYFDFELNTKKGDNSYDKDELMSMNLAVEKMIQYLNEKDDFNRKYEVIHLYFYAGSGKVPDFIVCSIKDVNQKYVFDGLSSVHCNELVYFYVMKSVASITIDAGLPKEYSYEDINQFSELKNLREIYYKSNADMEYLKMLKKGLYEVLPECKLYLDDVEVTLGDK